MISLAAGNENDLASRRIGVVHLARGAMDRSSIEVLHQFKQRLPADPYKFAGLSTIVSSNTAVDVKSTESNLGLTFSRTCKYTELFAILTV